MNKVISRGKYSLLTVLSLISVASLMSGAIRAIADEHTPHQHDDMRIVVLTDDNNWTDSHSEQNRAALFQNFLGHPGRAAIIQGDEEVTRSLLKEDSIRSLVEATLNEITTCPEETRKQLGYQDLSQVGFMPEILLQNDKTRQVVFTFMPDSNCTDRYCQWLGGCQIQDDLKECIKTSLGSVIYGPILRACENAKTAIEVVKHSSQLVAPVIGEKSPNAQTL